MPAPGIGLLVGTMMACSVGTPAPDKQTHCYVGLVTGTWVTVFTENKYVGMAVGCGLGAAKEIRDAQGFGTPDIEDFAYTCAASVLSSYAMENITIYYKNKQPMIGYKLKF